MSHSPAVLGAAVWVLLLIGGGVRAELIQWSYHWSRSPAEIHANSPGKGYIALTDGGLKSASGSTYLVATNLQAHSNAPTGNPDVFTNRTYTLNLLLQDKASGKSGTISFTGEFNGKLTAGSSNIKNSFIGATTQMLVLGANQYKVSIDSYGPPGPTGESNSGSIAARADVSVSTIFHTPEPSSVVLAFLGTVCLGFARRPFKRLSCR